MYIPVDRETCLRLPSVEGVPAKRPVVAIASNREKTFIATATEDALYIWLANPQLLLCVLSLSESDIAEKGKLRKIYWRYDSSAIAVITSTNHILIYRVDISEENVYNLTDNSRYRRSAQELFLRGHRPSISLFPAVIVNLAAPATCCVPLREELFVCVKNGYSHHISWEGAVRTDFSIRLASVPFAHDQLQSKPEYINDSTTHVVDAVYAPLIGGYCIVLSDGRAALLTSSDPRFHPNSLLGVWVNNIKDALCTDVNHKFRLLMFGCSNGEIAAFHLDDTNGSLVQTFRVPPSVIDGPEISSCSLACTRVTVLPNGSAFAAVWCNLPSEETKVLPPTAAIFSPFGAQLWCSLEGVTDLDGPSSLADTTVEWGTEGYQLWLGRTDGLGLQLLVRFAAACNPVMEHHDRVVLLSSSNVLISPPRDREPAASAPHAVWMPITYPNEYISANWPIRFASLDVEGKVLAVAGSRGLAHCNISTGRWKIFGNESQERDIYVTGGIVVWNGAVVVACSENDNTKELLRFYPVSTKLDNRFASVMDTECRVLQMNLRDDALVTFDVECRILLYKLNRTDDPKVADSYAQVSLDRIAEIRVGDLIPHAACLVSLQLTHLNLDTGGGTFIPGVDTVLVNVSGKLITLSPKKSAINDEERFQLNQPIMVASFVEQIWHDRMRTAGVIPVEETAILSNALWINCGSKGMRVWLPLLPGRKAAQNAQESSFISKRIMLPYELGIYPVVIYSADCLAVGVETVRMQLNLHGGKRLSYYNLHRNSEIFVHHLLRQLLKRNLGMFALEVAGACRRLPYFSHSLELLLHGVLEEEATSSEPIPDPLLPSCVAFIREFPEYLRTVAHCSRKTELALWPALFSVTGSPNDLFETCMRDGQLQTAASYLIVLQSMEHSQVSQEQSLRLLREALSAGEWTIARDIVRFANSIDADDMDSPARSPVSLHQARRTTSISLNNGEANEFVFSRFQSAASKVSKVRHSHDHKDGLRKDSTGSGKKVSRAMSNEMSPPSPSAVLNPLAEKIEAILIEHGQHLLDDFCIRDLGSFCTHLNVNTQRLMSRHAVNDFPLALTRLHSQFSWPYPVPGKHVVDQLEKKLGAMTTSKSTCSLNGSVNGELIRTSALIPKTPEDGVKRSRSPAISEGEESCSIKEAKLLPLGTDISPPMNGRQSPDSLATLPAPETPTTRSTNADWQGVDVLVGEATSKGPSISQLQLAVMLQFFSEACSIDWVFLLCLVSRDVSRLRKEINAGVISKWGLDSFGQLRLGCLSLLKWAAANCLGYVSILQVFHAHLEMAAEQAGIQNLPPTTAAVQERVSRKPEKSPVPLANGSIKQPALREAFQGRERSRSVDRLATTSSSATDEESEGCNIM